MGLRTIRTGRSVFTTARSVALAGALAVVAAGCGAGGNVLSAGGSALDGAATPALAAAPTPAYLAQAAESTIAVETGRVEGTVTAPGVSATISGEFDLPARSASLSLSVDADGQTSTAELVVDDGTVYVRPDGLGSALGEALGTPWMKVDLGDLGAMVPGTAELPAIDPAELIERLQTEGIEVTEVGREAVQGADTTHYRAAVPASTGAPSMGAATIDVWIDDAGLIRRVELRSDDGIEARVELLDLGQPVSIEVPASDQVTDLGDLAELLEKFTR